MDWQTHLMWDGVLVSGGAAIGYWLWRWKSRALHEALRQKEQVLMEAARREADTLHREVRVKANEEMLTLRTQTEQSFSARRLELAELETRLGERDRSVSQRMGQIAAEERALQDREEATHRRTALLDERDRQTAESTADLQRQLEGVARLSETEARTQLLARVERAAETEAAASARRILDQARAHADEKARWIISNAIQRYAGTHTFENTSATVALTGDDMKGRIIGREGRNIRAFENATGVTVLIDDTPGAVVLSGFDPVRRETAREAMTRLIADGRIHPSRIEEVVAKVKSEMDETLIRAGEDAVTRAGLPALHPEIVKILGRLKFRHSYSQNVLDHSIEVAHLTGLMAADLGIDIGLAKRAGLLHDLGKALSHETEGAHAIVGADFLRRHAEHPAVVNAVAAHHNEVPSEGPLGLLVSAADAISASRPGARSESMSTYLKRVDDLERIGLSFPGVEKAYAVQAGRELRIFVVPNQVTDDRAFLLAREIAVRIEEELQYPGQIRITVVRETRCVEVAK